jgi:hypothetical protein
MAKSILDFRNESNLKPPTLSWKDYYYNLEVKCVPLYHNGDRIDFLPFYVHDFESTIEYLQKYFPCGRAS